MTNNTGCLRPPSLVPPVLALVRTSGFSGASGVSHTHRPAYVVAGAVCVALALCTVRGATCVLKWKGREMT